MKKPFTILLCAMLLCSCAVNTSQESSSSSESVQNSPTEEQIKSSSSADDGLGSVYHKISADEARDIMLSSENYILLDVRTDEEYKENRISGAILIPDFEISDRASTELPDKNAVILIYCRSGRRSANTANALVGMGYTGIYDFGGILDWPYETISD